MFGNKDEKRNRLNQIVIVYVSALMATRAV